MVHTRRIYIHINSNILLVLPLTDQLQLFYNIDMTISHNINMTVSTNY
jgi:hypothetical protein